MFVLNYPDFFNNFFAKTYTIYMTKEEKLIKLESLKNKASELKKEADYYNALQLALF